MNPLAKFPVWCKRADRALLTILYKLHFGCKFLVIFSKNFPQYDNFWGGNKKAVFWELYHRPYVCQKNMNTVFFPPTITYLSMRNLIIIKWSAVRDPLFPLPWLLFISPSSIHFFSSLDCNNLLNNFPMQEFTATPRKLDGSVRLSDLWRGVSTIYERKGDL